MRPAQSVLCRFSLLALASLPAAARAQTGPVLPPSHAAVEGSGSTNVPFGRSTPMRMQAAYAASSIGGIRTIGGVAFRLDGGAAAASKSVDVEVQLSTVAAGFLALQPAFAANRGANQTVVLARRIVALASSPASVPAAFEVVLPFDAPFAFDPAAGDLLIEVVVHGQPPGTLALDATWVCDSPSQPFGAPGCGPSLSVATSQVLWGQPLFVQLGGAPASAATALVFGTRETGTFAGLPLPVDLGPFGAPGCAISTDLALVWSASADPTGAATWSFGLPASPWLQGEWLRFQGLAVDPGANPLGVVTTEGVKVEVCGWEPVARVWAGSTSATVGALDVGIAPVVELR